MEWPFSKRREGEKREFVEPHVVQDPKTGAVIGEAHTPEEAAQISRDNIQDWKEAA